MPGAPNRRDALRLGVTGAAAGGGPDPFFDVRRFGAKGDGHTIDVTLHLDRGACLLAAAPRDGQGFDDPGRERETRSRTSGTATGAPA